MVRGSCLCGSVGWRYDGTFEHMTHCHCGMCRKAHAAPFATYLVGPSAAFAFDGDADARVAYESSPGFTRSFCRHCGSVLPNPAFGANAAIPAGTAVDDPGIRPTAHIFVRSKAPWHAITDDLPRHDYYPGAATAAVARATRPPSTDGLLRGSCLCGDVAYTMSGAFAGVHNCHCSRCRRARAAAHTTNGFTATDNVRFTRGGDKLTVYRVPDARYFAQAFCRRCGSGMPRHDPERGIVIVPFGSLDDDPGRGADDHIFVRSKAPWYRITDDLPQFDEQAP